MIKNSILALAALCLSLHTTAQISGNTSNDFQDGTTQGWSNGTGSPNPPTNISDGGPGGIGDHFLEEISAGGVGAGSRLVILNTSSEWIGDYLSAGILSMDLNVKNGGGDDLFLRLAFKGGPNATEISSTMPVSVPNTQTSWTGITLPMDPFEFTVTNGPDTAEEVLSDVIEIRILSSVAPSYMGDAIVGTLHIDNIFLSFLFGTSDFDVAKVTAYPNPVTNIISIASEIPLERYTIYSISGQQLGAGQLNGASIDVAFLSSGFYYLHLSNGIDRQVLRFVKY